MKSARRFLAALALPFVGLSPVHAANEALIMSPVFPAAQTARQSFLRLSNPTANAGTVTVTVKTEAGTTLGTYTRAVAANTAPQVGMSDIEAPLATKPTADQRVRLEVTSDFLGTAQHVIYNPAGGALTNLSNCGVRIAADARTLTNVHTTLFKNNFPSNIVIANRGTTAGAATLDIYDSATGAKINTYTTASIPANGHITISEEAIEQALGFTPTQLQFHLTIKLTGAFTGAISHLVDNFGAGAITDMTQRCAMFGPPLSAFATASIASKVSYIGTFQTNVKPSNHGVIPFFGRPRLGAAKREGMMIATYVRVFTNANNSDVSLHENTFAALLEQGADGLMSLATSKYLPSAETQGAARVLVADFNGDSQDDIFLPASNENPFAPKASTVYLSKPDTTFTKQVLADFTLSHGSSVYVAGGIPYVVTAGYATNNAKSQNLYWFDRTSNTFMHKLIAGQAQAGGVALGDFFGDGTTQMLMSDLSQFTPFYGSTALPPEYLNGVYKFLSDDLQAFRVCCNGGTTVSGLFTAGARAWKLPTPWFNGKAEYASYGSIWDPVAKTHNAQAYAHDYNNDGKTDALIFAALYPGKPYAGSLDTFDWALSMMQFNTSRGNGVFTDDTATLNPEYKEYSGYDEVPAFFNDEAGGLLAMITAQGGMLDTARNYIAGSSGNRIFLNDGTGRMHLAMHDESINVADQVVRQLPSMASGCLGGSGGNRHNLRLLPYRTDSGNINFVGYIQVSSDSGCAGFAVKNLIMTNVPLNINLVADFRKNITITNRNGSKRMATFGGDDVFNKAAGDPDASLDGRSGKDVAVYTGARATYTIAKQSDGSYTIKDNSAGGTTDTLRNIETARFADGSVDLY